MQDQRDNDEDESPNDAEDDHDTAVPGGPVAGGTFHEMGVRGDEVEGWHFGRCWGGVARCVLVV